MLKATDERRGGIHWGLYALGMTTGLAFVTFLIWGHFLVWFLLMFFSRLLGSN